MARLGEILASGVIVRPSNAPRNSSTLAGWSWICPGCGAQLRGEIRECLACNCSLVDPDRVLERDAQLRFYSVIRPGGALVATRRLG